MPLYEFECSRCLARFEELVASGTERVSCPQCGAEDPRRLLSGVAPPARQHRSPGEIRSSEGRRSEREAARRERLAQTRRKRAKGELP